MSPIFLLLVFGILEYGLVYRDSLTIGDAASDGVRTAAILGAVPNADFSVMKQVRQSLSAIDPESIDRVVIFRVKAGSFKSTKDAIQQMPAGCREATTSQPGCNVYPGHDAYIALQSTPPAQAYFECNSTGDRACGYPPNSRLTGAGNTVIDYVGIYIKVKHSFVTGLFGSISGLEQARILRFEPSAD